MAGRDVFEWSEIGVLNEGDVALAVLGDPIGHSLSPPMHNAALSVMAGTQSSFERWSYRAIRVPAARLIEVVPMLWKKGFRGVNLTIPHKVEVLPLLKHIDPEAAQMGAVNTLQWREDGYAGFNTDGFGILKAVEESFGIEVNKRDVWLFGAGGAARAIAVACLNGGCRRLNIINRTQGRLDSLLEGLCTGFGNDARIAGTLSKDINEPPATGSLLINATSLGLKQEDPSPIPETFLSGDVFVYDTTYGITGQLARSCRERDVAYADGLSMLVWQGVKSLEIWSGTEVPADAMFRAAREALAMKSST